MHRDRLLRLLDRYHPVSNLEQEAKQQIMEFVKANTNCFKRSLAIGHITASSWLLDKNMERSLLMHHVKLNKWLQLGGHCDGDSDVLAMAIKETQEESGIVDIIAVNEDIFDLDVHLIPGNAKEAAHYHYDVRFLLKVNSNEEVQNNAESNELRWISKSRFDLPTNEVSVVRMFNKWC